MYKKISLIALLVVSAPLGADPVPDYNDFDKKALAAVPTAKKTVIPYAGKCSSVIVARVAVAHVPYYNPVPQDQCSCYGRWSNIKIAGHMRF